MRKRIKELVAKNKFFSGNNLGKRNRYNKNSCMIDGKFIIGDNNDNE